MLIRLAFSLPTMHHNIDEMIFVRLP